MTEPTALIATAALAQTDLIPKQGDNPWIWATGVLLILAGYLGREVIKDRDEWRKQAKDSTSALAANTDVLGKNTDLMAGMHKGNEDLGREVRNGFERINELLRNDHARRS